VDDPSPSYIHPLELGKHAFQSGENKVRVNQAEDSKTQLIESIILEVKNDYLNMQVAEKI